MTIPELEARCLAREDHGGHVPEYRFKKNVLARWPHTVRTQCKVCKLQIAEEMPFGHWVEMAYASAKLGGRCWLQATGYADYCSCAACYRENRYPNEYGPSLYDMLHRYKATQENRRQRSDD